MKENTIVKTLSHHRTLAARFIVSALLLAGAGSALSDVHYVDVNSTNATPPYTNWTTAATNIQDGVDVAVAGDEIVVTNGAYLPLVANKPLTIHSVNGAGLTLINGGALARCVSLTNGTVLTGFTLTNGYAAYYGGGAQGGTLDNCTLSRNSAYLAGGGAYFSTLNNCMLSSNSASSGGGGAEQCTLNNSTLIGNSASGGGGAESSTLNNCMLTGNFASHGGGGAFSCTLNNCTLNSNSSPLNPYLVSSGGGGAYACTLSNCTLSGNSSSSGGGAYQGTLTGCTLNANTASLSGGGAYAATLNRCALNSNSASNYGGGAYQGTLSNCTLSGNSGSGAHASTLKYCAVMGSSGWGASSCILSNCTLNGNGGGGAYSSTLANSILSDNSGNGAVYSALNNCTVTGNSGNGGASSCTLRNCIVYFNQGANYDSYSTLNYCCTTPLPTNGVGNISLDPQLASVSRLSAGSPCRGAGNAADATGNDIDGESWASSPSIGCDEYHAGAVTGPLGVGMIASFTNVALNFKVQLKALIEGRTTVSFWDFGDGITATNQPYTSHFWTAPGDYAVVLRAFNDSQPSGITATVTVHVVAQPVHYVAADSTNPVAPYLSWATAATNIQDAVDAATVAGVVLVTNGLYSTGGRAVDGTLTNRVAVDKPLALRSVNGPQFTVIQGRQVPGTTNGDGAIRCVYLANGASLSGFTLTNGATRTVYGYPYRESSGGGLWCESTNAVAVSNCVAKGNSGYLYGGGAYQGALNNCTMVGNSAQLGGGAYQSALNNCTLSGNYGGGACYSTLNSCTVTANSSGGAIESALNNCVLSGNSANAGGGANFCTLNNCTLSGNSASGDYGGGGAYGGTLNNCTLTGNLASRSGGGAYGATLNNCTLSGNSASGDYGGGGAYGGTLNNCTLTGNLASHSGGGAYSSTLNNCIVYFNTAQQGTNYSNCVLNYCCTTPQPTNGIGSISAEPQLASAIHLSAGSACRAAAYADYTTGTDIDGEPWANPPSIGCDEFITGSATGLLTVAISANYTYLGPGIPVDFAGQISGHASASRWEFDDGTVSSNRPYASLSWASPGDYTVVLRAYNESNPGGVTGALTIHVVAHPTHYVAAASSNPIAPYTSWSTAATNIQDAVDAAATGAEIVVSNGIYASGGRVVYGTLTNRVAVDKPLTLHSVNGSQFTTIQGKKAPSGDGYGNGVGAIRCVYLADGASLSGFTLTNGATLFAYEDPPYRQTSGGGVWCESTNAAVSNCVVAGNLAYGAAQGTLNNCVVTNNSSGGAVYCTLNNCTVTRNPSSGAVFCKLNTCTLTGNFTYGANGCTLSDCTLIGNSGVGAAYSTLRNCTVTANSSGGAHDSTLNNCALTGNSGWGAANSMLTNCTLTGNSNGVTGGTLNNCIVFFNPPTAGATNNYSFSSTLNYCCTTPLPTNGVGNISLDPELASASHLSAGSPCRAAGNADYATGTDIDGETWASPPSIGCDEYHAGAVTGALQVAFSATAYVKAGSLMPLTAMIQGRTTDSIWDFGDGFLEVNQPYTFHAWEVPGDYRVALWCFNESHRGGVSAVITVHVRTLTDHNYVAADGANPVPPYTSWATAATNIQDAVFWAASGALVEVTNGIYKSVTVDNPLTLRSVNGRQFTTIDGGGLNQCVYLPGGSSLSGFTLTHGRAAGGSGGGVACGASTVVVSNCTITANSAYYSGGGASGGTLHNCTLTGNSASYFGGGGAAYCTLNNCILTGNTATGYHTSYSYRVPCGFDNWCWITRETYYPANGGGAYYCTLNNCTLSGNSALNGHPYPDYSDTASGGGAYESWLKNCTLVGNSAGHGGGVAASTLNNCIVYFNDAPGGDNYEFYDPSDPYSYGYSYSYLNQCCTTPEPGFGVGNITDEPLFVDQLGSNLRLQSDSPCINAGNNAYAFGSTDLDGNPRIAGGTVDIGAYELQSPASRISYAWLQAHGLPIDASTDASDPDADGMNNWQEWVAGTVPTDGTSLLRLLAPVPTPPGLLLRWNGDTNHAYFIERATTLKSPLTFSLLRTNVAGLPGTTTFTDTTPPAGGAAFYRVGTYSTNAASPLWLQPPVFTPASVVITWTSVANRSYFLERATNLATPMQFVPLASNIPGRLGTTTYTDTNATGAGPWFYRVGVRP